MSELTEVERETIESLKKDINHLGIEELKERVVSLFRELRQAHAALSSLNMEVQLWAGRKDKPIRILRRDFKNVEGWLGSTIWALSSVTLQVMTREQDYATKVVTIEAKTVTVPANMIVQAEEIHDKQEMTPEEETGLLDQGS